MTARRPASPAARPRGAAARRTSERPVATTRPTPRRRTGGRASGPAAHEQVRVPRLFTARALVVGVVLGVSFLLVYPTLHAYLGQRAELTAARRELVAAKADNADLTDQLTRWDDPAYVKSQARQRLSFVMPGERGFRVVDPGTATDQVTAGDGPAGTLTGTSTGPWYDDVWTSVTIAGKVG